MSQSTEHQSPKAIPSNGILVTTTTEVTSAPRPTPYQYLDYEYTVVIEANGPAPEPCGKRKKMWEGLKNKFRGWKESVMEVAIRTKSFLEGRKRSLAD